ncbi:MAG: CotH kinase family protein [Janthinobacterium lividum]
MRTTQRTVTGLAVAIVLTANGIGTAAFAAPPDPGGVLDPIQSNSSGTQATATAHFTPAHRGHQVKLQTLTLVTANTDEVKTARWKTLETEKEDAKGDVTFDIDNPLEVAHSYRAITDDDDETVSNEVTFAASATTKSTGLSTIYLNTDEGHSINTRKRYFEGQFTMTASSALPECKAVPTQSHATAKGRGNYSWTFSKKSFTLKLDKKTDLCGMGKSKKWALISGAYDKSLLRTSAAFDIGSKLTNMAWTPQAKPVDLYINGSYRGSYLLAERITIDENRVDIDELSNGSADPTGANDTKPNITGGYLLEWDFRKSADHNVSAGHRGWVGIKEPEDEDDDTGITKQQVHYVNTYLDATDQALYGSSWKSDTKGWKKYIDEKSAVDYYIAQEIMKPVDGNMWASVYMYKARDGKLFFGPMWDYDLAAGSADRAGNTRGATGWYLKNKVGTTAKQSSSTWFNRLNDDPDFQKAVKARWKEVYPQLKTEDAFLGTQKSVIAKSADANFDHWSVHAHISAAQVVKGSWSKEVSYLRSWLKSRISWMDKQY